MVILYIFENARYKNQDLPEVYTFLCSSLISCAIIQEGKVLFKIRLKTGCDRGNVCSPLRCAEASRIRLWKIVRHRHATFYRATSTVMEEGPKCLSAMSASLVVLTHLTPILLTHQEH
jgi:hypothetical protein